MCGWRGDDRIAGPTIWQRKATTDAVSSATPTGPDARAVRPPPTRLGRAVRAAAKGGFTGCGPEVASPAQAQPGGAEVAPEDDEHAKRHPRQPRPYGPLWRRAGRGWLSALNPVAMEARGKGAAAIGGSARGAGPQGRKHRAGDQGEALDAGGWRRAPLARPRRGLRRVVVSDGPEGGKVEERAQRLLVHTSWAP